jgi:uncharacterized protein
LPTDHGVFEGFHVIDCDSHLTEPPDLWSARTPASLQEKMPALRTVDGRTGWYLNDELWASTGGNTIRTGHNKTRGLISVQPFDEVDSAAYDVTARLALLDEIGIWAQILYPNGIGFNSNHLMAIEDNDQRLAVLRTYNDFTVDVQNESGGRMLPQPVLPIWDMRLTVEEMDRLVRGGIKGFTISDKPELLGLPELPDRFYEPMWDTFNESGAVANFHINSGGRKEADGRMAVPVPQNMDAWSGAALKLRAGNALSPSWEAFGPQRSLAVSSTLSYMSNVRIISNLCMSNMFDRYPNLKVVSAESGIGWVPFLLEALEYQLDEYVTDVDERIVQKRRPTEYFRDHIYVMFWFESSAPKHLIEDIGVNNVLIETDIPHPTCLYPGTAEHFTKVLGGMSKDALRRILQDNAAELYGITLPS